MPIDLPNLDDRSFADLVDEGRRMIPGLAPSWTDHNPSDPGITLIELFAYLSELLIFRTNRVSEANKRAFVKLLDPQWTPTPGLSIDDELSAAVRRLRIEERAVTAADFERLAGRIDGVARAHCLAHRVLDSGSVSNADVERKGHTSLIVVCAPGANGDAVLQAVRDYFVPPPAPAREERCLLTTQLHVVKPAVLGVAVRLSIVIDADQLKDVVHARAIAAIGKFLDPLSGGSDGSGWRFGAAVYRSDIYTTLDRVEGVDYVRLVAGQADLFVSPATQGDRNIRIGSGGDSVGLRLYANELVRFDQQNTVIEIVAPIANVPG
jgi:hypothetical protein